MVKINYKSDFKINEKSETVALEVPFVFSYYVFDSKKYVVSFDGHNYVNCERKEDGSLDVIFNQPDFGIGHLKVERKYAVDDKAFVDGVFDVVTVDKTDVFITSGQTFETYVKTVVVPPYIKGDKGDPMTWETMTEKERGELVKDVAEAIDPEMVMTENEKSRQEAEQSRQTAEQQRSATFNTLKGEMQSAITAGNTAAGNAQKVVDEYDTKVAEQDSKLTDLGSKVITPLITNVFNPSTITEGKYAHFLGYGTNTLADLEGAMVSDFIPVKPNQYVMEVGSIGAGSGKNNRSYLWYDESKKKKADGQMDWVQGELKQVPEGCYYIRVSAASESVGTMMLLVSDVIFDVPSEYIPFGNSIGGESKIDINSREIAKTNERVDEVNIDLAKLENNILTASIINVFNPNTITEGKYAHYLGYGTNTLVDMSGAMVSDFIAVKPNQYVMEVGSIGAGSGKNNRSYLWYDESKKKKADGQMDWVQGELKQVPEGCYYIRVSAASESVGTMMLLVSDVIFDVPSEYIPYGEGVKRKNKIDENKNNIQLVENKIKELENEVLTPPIVNMFNPSDIEINKSVNQVYGFISDAQGKFASGFISVKPKQYVMEVGGTEFLNDSTASSFCWYDSAKQKKVEGQPTWTQGEIKQVPDDCYFLRITNTTSYKDSLMILVGDSEFSEPEKYISFGEEKKGELKVESAKINPYKGLYGVVLGDSHSTNRMQWVPRMFEKIGMSYDLEVITEIIGNRGANHTGDGYEDYCDPTYAQAVRAVEQYKSGHKIDFVFLENTHYVQPNPNISETIPFIPKNIIDGGTYNQQSSEEDNWFNSEFVNFISSKSPSLGTLVRTSWNSISVVFTFTGTPIVGTLFTLEFNGVKYAVPIETEDTLTTFVHKMGTYVFGEGEWMTTTSGTSMTLTYVGSNYVAPTISYTNGGSGVSMSYEFSTSTTRKYRYFNSYELSKWTDKNCWILQGGWEISSLMGAIEYLLSNIDGLTIVAVAFPTLAIGKNEFISVAEMKASNKWRYHRTNCDNLLNVAMHYGLKRIDLDDCWGVTLPNWFMYMNENDAHAKKEGYQRIADTICREFG